MNSLHRMGYTSNRCHHSVAKRHSRWRNVITSQGERALPLQWQVVKLSQGHDKVTRTRAVHLHVPTYILVAIYTVHLAPVSLCLNAQRNTLPLL